MALAKTAVVVGIGPGLGAAAARRFAREGYKVALVSRSPSSLEPVEKEITAAGGHAASFPTDAGSPADLAKTFQQIRQELGSPEVMALQAAFPVSQAAKELKPDVVMQVLIYNAGPGGISWPPPGTLDIKPEQFAASFNSGVVGALAAAQEVLPAMIENKSGTIIFTGATAALRGSAKFILLSAPKFALRSLAQSLAREFQPKKVHVALVNIDGQIFSERMKARMPDKPMDTYLDPEAIADTYWSLHKQSPSAWTQELDMRPFTEKW